MIVAGLGACQSAPERLDTLASDYGMARFEVTGEKFRHIVYRKNGDAQGGRLHVYIDGDGSPWVLGRYVADEPSPRNPLLLQMMSQDRADAIYLGRPCYLGLASSPPCQSVHWTDRRYAPEIIDSMAAAIRRIHGDARPLVLIGYSGGGAIATLLAEHLRPALVITVAANLDTEAWVKAHGYRPLYGSLNPIEDARLHGIPHIHYTGDKDRAVNPEQAGRFVARHGGRRQSLTDSDHRCCWLEQWPVLLESALDTIR